MNKEPSPAKAGHWSNGARRHDEAYLADGSMRSHWQYVLSSVEALGTDALAERQLKAQRILRDDGATYNVYSQPQSSRTWALDPIPLIIESEQWSEIERGLLERVELLNLLLADIYGERTIISSGRIPPELIFSHGGFLRACYDVQLPGPQQLILHCADMIRDTQGNMVVIGDRSQAPSGAGYALENRTVMSRVLPSLFRDSHVHRLALFFRSLRNRLHALSPNSGTPRIVVLTPGAHNETYFEHAYLANYLGFSLVQGSDLTVRDGELWLKSLDGLKRVDVVLRRVDDYFCDPVELKTDSHLGVPGLLDVARNGRVAIVNPLGSGVLENPALLKYFDVLGQHFLGHRPRLKSARTWWCGDPDDLAFVRENFDKLMIKPCFRRPGSYSVIGAECTEDEKARMLKLITKHPLRFAAQEIIAPSLSPSLIDGKLQGRPTVMRSFAVAGETDYNVMPGGLTRVSIDDNQLIVTNQSGSISKDTWIIASEPEKQITLIGDSPATSVMGDDRTDLPSRVVENMFWMGRYAERAEAAMRLLRIVLIQLNDIEQLPNQANAALLRAITHLTATYPGFTGDNKALLENPDEEIIAVIIDHRRPGSIAANLVAMLGSADEVKELLSADTQRIINDIRDELNVLETNLHYGLGSAPEEDLDPLVTALLALAGLSHESMVRGPAWRFMEMGRRLERALQTVTLVRSLLVTAIDNVEHNLLLEPILLSLEALITYRRRYHAQLNVANGLEIILLDQSNPRSLLYQIEHMRNQIDNLQDNQQNHGPLSRESRYALEASATLKLCELSNLAKVTPKNRNLSELDQLMARMQHLLGETAAAIAERYFDHTEGPQPLVRTHWEDYL